MLILEAKQRQDDRWDALRNALVGHDPDRYLPRLFPEMVPEEVQDDDDLEDTSGEWRFEEQVAPEDAAALMERLLSDPSGVITGKDAMSEGKWV